LTSGALLAALLSAVLGIGSGASLARDPTNDRAASTEAGRFELHVPVVYYHRIECYPEGASAPGNYTCPEQFETQLAYVRDHGWHTITIDQLADLMANRQCPDKRTFVVSIDDGAVDSYTAGAPILEALGMRGSFFVSPGYAGASHYMSFDQMRDLVARGHAIGNHTLKHVSLPHQTPEVLYQQIEVAQQMLNDELGFRPRTFAYPYGRYGKTNDDVINAVRDSGFELAFTVVRGAREASDAPLLSRRVRIAPSDTGPQALARLEPFADGCPPPTADLTAALSKTGPFKGNNVYATTAIKSQAVVRTAVAPNHTYGYWIGLQNDGQFSDAFKVTAAVGGPAATVQLLVGGVDVTAQILAGTYQTGVRDPWSSMLIHARITPGSGGLAGQAITLDLSAHPISMSDRIDVVRLKAVY